MTDVDPATTLLAFVRDTLGLTGAKLTCGEGGCGACTVMVSHWDADLAVCLISLHAHDMTAWVIGEYKHAT